MRHSISPFTLALIGLLMFQFIDCGYLFPSNQTFSFPRTQYNGNEIRINWFYQYSGTETSGSSWSSILFLYQNGIVLDGGIPLDSELASREESYANGTYHAAVQNAKGVWGIFDIVGQSIIYEYWKNPNGSWKVVKYTGTIMNDTTIHFTSSEMLDGSENSTIDETYHFKQFSPKPDSVTQFIQ